MHKFRLLAILMVVTILGITGFQLYWLKNNYDREKRSLELQTNASFRQTILRLQASKLKLEAFGFETGPTIAGAPGVMVRSRKDRRDEPNPVTRVEQPITLMNLLQEKMKDQPGDSLMRNSITISTHISGDSLQLKGSRQLSKKINTITISSSGDSLFNMDPSMIREIAVNTERRTTGPDQKIIAFSINDKATDSIRKQPLKGKELAKPLRREGMTGNIIDQGRINVPGRDAMFRFLYNVDSISLRDSITIREIDSAYAARLRNDRMKLAFTVSRLDSSQTDSTSFDEVTLGFTTPITYKLQLENKAAYILGKLTMPVLFSFFLIGITIMSFVLLYRSMLRQRNLAELKNQFISNITHELKTPIATVGVAIEALRNFNAIQDPERTREYLDISQNELQRLGLLVDKVLKLSVFEKKEIELKKEQFDFRGLTEEIMNSMKLQFDKYHAKVRLHASGDNFIIDADKLHLTSVIYNLLDNALKYSKEDPVIDVTIASHPEYVQFSVSDNGIGIEPEFRKKIFDKFFRVPTGDRHNIKGYGLGLSYVAEVIKRHHGQVDVQSEFGKGSTFTAQIPLL